MTLYWFGHLIDGVTPPIPERGSSWAHPQTGVIYDAVVGDQEGALFWITRYIPLGSPTIVEIIGVHVIPSAQYKPLHGGYPS